MAEDYHIPVTSFETRRSPDLLRREIKKINTHMCGKLVEKKAKKGKRTRPKVDLYSPSLDNGYGQYAKTLRFLVVKRRPMGQTF